MKTTTTTTQMTTGLGQYLKFSYKKAEQKFI